MVRARIGVVVAAALTFTAVVVGTAQPAFAHTELTGSTPAADSTVTTAVASLTLTFTEPVKQQFTTVNVLGPDGASYSVGAARSVDNTVVQDIQALPVGAIRVTWRTVASDGDTVQGEFGFANQFTVPVPTTAAPTTAAPTTAAAASSTSVSAPATVAEPSPAANDGGGSGATVWVVVAVILAIVAAAGFWWIRRQRSP